MGLDGVEVEEEDHVDRAEWEAMSESERQEYIDQAKTDAIANRVDCYVEVED